MKKFIYIIIFTAFTSSFTIKDIRMQVHHKMSIDSLGACQGVSIQNGRVFLYGDRETGVLREYKFINDTLRTLGSECRFTIDGQDIVNHPTGIAWNGIGPTFIGNSVRLNKEGTKWKAIIYNINWDGFLKTGTLDGNLISTIDDDTCIQGTRPEYIKYKQHWYVATADYGNKENEVRLYNPEKLAKCKKTSDDGVLYKKFQCSPWVQNLHWIPEKGYLVLIQNQIEGRKWRFTFLDLEKSIERGKEVVVKTIDINSEQDELEGFALFKNDLPQGIAVSSSRKNNVRFININW